MNKTDVRWAALAAAAGTGAYAFPLIVPWHILFLAPPVIGGALLPQTRTGRLIWTVLCTVVLAEVLLGFLPSPVAAAILSASVLFILAEPAIASAVLVMNLSLAMTLQARFAEFLHQAGLEATAPSLIAIAIIWLARPRNVGHVIGAGVLSVIAGWAVSHVAQTPDLVMMAAALPAIGLAALLVQHEPQSARKVSTVSLSLAVFIALISWIWTPPRNSHDAYVILPVASDAFEAKFFSNFMEALAFAGIEAKQATRIEDIPPESLLVLPWLTSPFTNEPGDPLAKRIGELSRERRWTVLAAGEHSNMGGVATRIETMAGRPMLRPDLTVPRSNTDTSGPLRVSGPRAWPHEAVLNRGASLKVTSFDDKVLLAGDGWWAEPDIGEWLWVGDYIWRSGDRAGRLPLAISSDIDGARWVVVGDNSLLLSNQLIADPRPVIRLLELATLWPTFFRDGVLSVLAFLFALRFAGRRLRWWLPGMVIGSVAVLMATASAYSSRGSIAWRDIYIGESGFDERNFNVALADNPTLIENRRLIRIKKPVSGTVEVPEGNSLIFMLVEGSAEVGGVRLSECHRIGSLMTAKGPYLMDAQACKVDGSARILIGTSGRAAAFTVPNATGETLVLLDVAFLARHAPGGNAKWLLKELGER